MTIAYSPSALLVATEVAIPDGTPSLTPFTRLLSDTRAYTRVALAGQLVWNGLLAAYGTAAAPFVDIGSIETMTLNDGAGWRNFTQVAGITLTVANVSGGGPLAAATWYYVYAWANAGDVAPHFQITTTAPTAPRRAWKSGETVNYRYLGCFRTDAAGNVINVRGQDHTYVYDRSAAPCAIASFYPVFGGVAPVAWTTAPLNYGAIALVPPHAYQALLSLEVQDAAGAHINIRTDGGSPNYYRFPYLDTLHATTTVEQTLNGAKAIDYQDGGGFSVADDVYIGVLGWRE